VDDVPKPTIIGDDGVADRAVDLPFVGVEDRCDRDSVLAEDRRAGDRLAEASRADERDVVLALGAEDLADLAEQAVDRVADAPLAELAEVRKVAANLRRVDVRVIGDLLRGDPVLTHLLRLRENLQIARETCGDADSDTVVRHARTFDGALQHRLIVPKGPRARRENGRCC